MKAKIAIFIVLCSILFTKAEPQSEKNEEGDEDLTVLVEDAKDYAHYKGAILRSTDCAKSSDRAAIAPFTLFPSPVPRKLFQQAVDVHEPLQLLYFRIAQDHQFLADTFREMRESGKKSYLTDMFDIYEETLKDGLKQPIIFTFTRADYMLNSVTNEKGEKNYELKQVEINTGNVGASAISERITDLHRRMLTKAGKKFTNDVVPDNNAAKTLARGLVYAWEYFADPDSIMLVTMTDAENSIHFNAKFLDYEVEAMTKRKLKIVYMTMGECAKKLKLDPVDFTLSLVGRKISVVYFRDIYSSRGIKPPKLIFEAFRKIHRSTAIKCPSAVAEIVGSKKIQQVLAQSGMVERFFPNVEDAKIVDKIRATFTGLWALDDESKKTKLIIKDAIDHPDRYVIKSMGEGGGNIFFDDEVAEKLRTFTASERSAHILMQRLRPMVFNNYSVRPLEPVHFGEMVTELGIYGFFMGHARDHNIALYNHTGGHLMRTKRANANEGGITHGTGAYDSPYLF